MRKTNGITLIALVITIIVLLILAGVSISAITGENGIIQKAKDASEKTKEAEQEENDTLKGYEDYINSADGKSEEKRNISVIVTQTEGEELWSNTVTLKISLGEEEELTLEQKQELVAYMFDYSSYEDFKSGVEEILLATTGEEITYEDLIELELAGDEELALETFLDYGYSIVSYKDTEKLEDLGVKVIKVETPYETTLYTNSYDGEVACTFCENGEYTFTIASGATTVTETVEVRNIRDYSTEAPYDIYAEMDDIQEEFVYSIDDSEETFETVTTVFECNNSFSLHDVGGGVYRSYYINLDKEFYKYFNNLNDLWYDGLFSTPMFFVSLANGLKTNTVRQLILRCMFTGELTINTEEIDVRAIDCADEILNMLYNGEITEEDLAKYNENHNNLPESILLKYPELSVSQKDKINFENESGYDCTFEFSQDSHVYLRIFND